MTWRRWMWVALIGLFVAIVVSRRMQVADLIGVLLQGRPAWLAAALAFQLLWFLNQTALYQSIYRALKLPARFGHLLPIMLAGTFVNVATPTASLGALPLFLDDARRRGLDEATVTLTNLVRVGLNLAWFSLLLSFSLVVLFLGHLLRAYHLIAAAILLTSAVLLLAGLVLAGRRPDQFAQLLERLAGVVRRVGQRVVGRDLIAPGRASEAATRFSAAASALWTARRQVVRPWIHTMLLDVLEVAVLVALFRAFPTGSAPPSLINIVAAYSIGVLFSVVAITPQGLGVVEATLVAAFTAFGVPMGYAAVVMLAYRGLSFWLPVLVGFVALRWVHGLQVPATQPDHAPAE